MKRKNRKNKNKLKKEFDTSGMVQEFIDTEREKAQLFRQKLDPIMREMDTFDSGKQWATTPDSSGVKLWHEKPVTNYVHLIKNKRTTEATYSNIKIKLLPLSSNHIEEVEILEQVINNIWNRIDAMYTVNETTKNSRLFPYGVTKIQYAGDKIVGTKGNLNKGQLQIIDVSPSNFYWDPKANDLESADYAFEMVKVTKSFLLRQKHFDQSLVNELIETEESKDKSGEERSGDIFNDRDYHTGQEKGNYVLVELYMKYPINESTDKVLKAYIVNGKVLYKVDDIEQPELPYSLLLEYKQTQKFAGVSSAMLILDNQKYINKVDGIIHGLATQYQNPQKIVASESGLDPTNVAKHGDIAGAVFLVDGDIDKAIRNVKPNEIDRTLIEVTKEKKEDIKMIAQITPPQAGQSIGTAGATASGARAVLSQANQQDSDPKYQFQHYLKRMVRIMLNYIKYNGNEVEYRLDHNADNPHEYSFIKINSQLYKDIEHDMIIRVPLSQSEKQQQKNEVFQLMGFSAQTGVEYLSPKMVLDLMDFDNKVELINHLHNTEEAKMKQRELKTAEVTANLMVEALSEVSPGTSLQELGKAAAMQAVEIVEEQEKKAKGGTGGGGVGVSAPQRQG